MVVVIHHSRGRDLPSKAVDEPGGRNDGVRVAACSSRARRCPLPVAPAHGHTRRYPARGRATFDVHLELLRHDFLHALIELCSIGCSKASARTTVCLRSGSVARWRPARVTKSDLDLTVVVTDSAVDEFSGGLQRWLGDIGAVAVAPGPVPGLVTSLMRDGLRLDVSLERPSSFAARRRQATIVRPSARRDGRSWMCMAAVVPAGSTGFLRGAGPGLASRARANGLGAPRPPDRGSHLTVIGVVVAPLALGSARSGGEATVRTASAHAGTRL